MSVGAMSDTVVNHILGNLRKKVNEEFAKNPSIKSGKISDLPEISVFGSQIRLGADKDQEGIMTQRSLDLLAQEFREGSTKGKTEDIFGKKTKATEYAKGPNSKGYPLVVAYLESGKDIRTLARAAAMLLGNPKTFDQFVAWYKIKYLGELTKANIRFSDKTVGTRYESGLIIDPADSGKNDLKALIAKGVAHREFNARFAQFIATKNPLLSEFIDANTDAGHFLGIFNSKFATILDLEVDQVQGGNVYDLTVKSKLGDASLGKGMDTYIESMSQSLTLMAQADAISSNLLSNISLASTTSKRVHTKSKNGAYVASTEVQISRANQAAGRKLSAAARQLKKLAQTAKDASVKGGIEGDYNNQSFRKELIKLFESISTLGSYIDSLADKINAAGSARTDEEKALALALKAQAGTIANVLKDTSGSDSFNTAISKSLKAAFKGQPKPAEQYTVSKDSLPLGKPSNKNLKVPNVKKSKSSVTSTSERPVKVKIPKVNMSLALPTNLTGLEELINSQLVERIKQNMGSGNRRDILNLRTGRFAESVKVERLSESRAGMITAFYTYMRNPYATFSEGGKQQSPRSRDPKLLISKSIREIAQAKVQNRLRAVLV